MQSFCSGLFFFFSKRILLVAFSSLPYCYSVAMWNKFQGQAITLLTFLITPLLWAKNQSESGMSMEASSNNACLSWGSGWALLSYVISHLCCFTPTFDFFSKESIKPEAKQSWNSTDNKFKAYAHLPSHMLNCSFMSEKPLQSVVARSSWPGCHWRILMGKVYFSISP